LGLYTLTGLGIAIQGVGYQEDVVMGSDFWVRVQECPHKNMSKDYYRFVSCAHGDLGCSGGHESHCLDCGVYIIKDPCGDMSGQSGWPYKRWIKDMWSYRVWGE
jgi:hypothetical protein